MKYIFIIAILFIVCSVNAQTSSNQKRLDSLMKVEADTYHKVIVSDSAEKEKKRPKNKGHWKYDRIKRNWADSTKTKIE